MRRVLKWALVLVAVVAVCGFGAFLYFIPPFFTTPPEEFGKALASAAPDVNRITDPAERAIASRGRYLVMTVGCIGCHATNGSQGPDLTRYLAGGALKIHTPQGTFVSRNLTPDPETGIGRRTDDELKRVLRSGTFADGHVAGDGDAMASCPERGRRHAVVTWRRTSHPRGGQRHFPRRDRAGLRGQDWG
jgi:hypothetical protein